MRENTAFLSRMNTTAKMKKKCFLGVVLLLRALALSSFRLCAAAFGPETGGGGKGGAATVVTYATQNLRKNPVDGTH